LNRDLDASTTQELEVSLQTWIVFGLLHEVFGSLLSDSDFLEPRHEGPDLLTTAKLPAIAAQWIALYTKLRDTDDGRKLLEHFRECIMTAHRALTTSSDRADLDKTILRSAVSVAETIGLVVVRTLQNGPYTMPTMWE